MDTTRKCTYVDCCNYADSIECIDNDCGCIKRYLNQEEAENPLKSRHRFKITRNYEKVD